MNHQRRTRSQKRVANSFKRFIKATGQPVQSFAEFVCGVGAVFVALHAVAPTIPEATSAFNLMLTCTTFATWHLKLRLERRR